MRKILPLIFWSFASSIIQANTPATTEQEPALQSSYNAYLKLQGISVASQGVQVVPSGVIHLPNELKIKLKQILTPYVNKVM